MTDIVLITVDSLRYDYVFGPNAPDSLKTLPELADRGVRYDTAFSNASYTKASFLSILSGTYPWMFDSVQDGFGPDRPHLAECLREAGYATGGFHTNAYLSPTYNYDRGFDYYTGRDSGGDGGRPSGSGLSMVLNALVERTVATPGVSDVVHRLYESIGRYAGVNLGGGLYEPAADLNEDVLRWTDQCESPAFVWVHYMDVHTPYYPHDGTVSEGISRRRAIKLFHRANQEGTDIPDSDIETLERLYRGEVEYFDRQLGRLLDGLEDTIGLDDTVVAFSSDHGEAFDENGALFHPGYRLFDENIHIPFILRGPGIGRGRVTTPVSNVDLVPTLLSRAGIDVPESVVGEDVTTFVDDPPSERLAFAQSFNIDEGYAMVTDGSYKLIRDMERDRGALYDRRGPPGAQRDCGKDHPSVKRDLAAALDDHVRSVKRSRGTGDGVEVSEDVRLQLRKLGYDE